MIFKILIVAAFVGIAKAGVLSPAIYTEFDPNPQYNYEYGVQDPLTGDSKSQYESRRGDLVRGSYSLIDPDGTRRTVDYTADPLNGFNAVVSKVPIVPPVQFVHSSPVARQAHLSTPISQVAYTAQQVVGEPTYSSPAYSVRVNAPSSLSYSYAA